MRAAPLLVERPVVRWHGGKWRLAPWIISHFPPHRIYVEPYGGGASVLLRKQRSYAEVYNDLDGRIVNLFRVLRDERTAAQLLHALELTPFARDEFEGAYSGERACAGDSVERARRLLVICFQGFGSNAHGRKSGFRSNSNRSGTTPAHDWRNFPSALPRIVERLQGCVIENRPALEVMAQHDGLDTLHYLDPPYLPATRDRGVDYDHEMTREDHLALLAAARGVRGMVAISGYGSALYDEALVGWARVERPTYADGARPRVECLWLSPALVDRASQKGLFAASEALAAEARDA
jgi:DNA adenine methylase